MKDGLVSIPNIPIKTNSGESDVVIVVPKLLFSGEGRLLRALLRSGLLRTVTAVVLDTITHSIL